jgi:hypothetical protein
MKLRVSIQYIIVLGVVALLASLSVADSNRAVAGSKGIDYLEFNSDGELVRPTDYRSWVYVGTPLTPNELNGGNAPFPEFHNVYIDPSSFEHYRDTGEFPDGTVLIKELVSVGSKQAVSGKGYFMGDFLGLEATIKSKDRFPDEPGHWAYYSFGHEYPLAKSAKEFPAAACNACHAASAADDFVFTQYYPVLRVAKGAKSNPENSGTADGHDGATCEVCKAGLDRFAETTEAAGQPTGQAAAGDAGGIPTDKDKLFAFLKEGKYKSFPASESGLHPSRGPHSIKGTFGQPVRSYLNASMKASLEAKNEKHPQGAGIVKEMFSAEGELQGWAVSVKTHGESDFGKGWYWYESTSTTDANALVANGNGVSLCSGCHATGSDFVLTGYPLK